MYQPAVKRPFDHLQPSQVPIVASLLAQALSKDDKLRADVEHLAREVRAMPVKTRGENTRRSIMRVLTEEAARSGKLVKDGIRITLANRPIVERAATSPRSVSNAIERLETDGYLRRDNRDRKREKAGAFVLFTGRALGMQEGRSIVGVEGNLEQGSGERFDSYGGCDPGAYLARGVHAQIPELRWSTTLKRREIDKFGGAVEVREHLARLGKKCGAIVEHVLEAGGSATVAELMERFAGEKTRPWDFKRRTLAPLEDPAVIVVEGDTVTLTDDWRGALEHAREMGGEHEAARLQRERHARNREAFRNRYGLPPAEPVPEAPSIDDLRQPWAYHPEPCACRECEKRFGKVIGEHVEDCRCGPCAKARCENSKAETRELLRVVDGGSLPPGPEPDDSHTLSCVCESCAYPEPRYARPWGSA